MTVHHPEVTLLDIQTISPACVALLVHKAVGRGEAAAALVRAAQARAGLDPWPSMELDLFPAGDRTLILARPADRIRVSVAEYALPYLPQI